MILPISKHYKHYCSELVKIAMLYIFTKEHLHFLGKFHLLWKKKDI